MTSLIIHYSLHFFLPLFVAKLFFNQDWKKAYIIMISTMIVDIDHLLATPIYQADRCSINFHPLHSYFAIAIYIIMSFLLKEYFFNTPSLLKYICSIHLTARTF